MMAILTCFLLSSNVRLKLYLVGLLVHLLIKELQPGDSEGTFLVFLSSCHLLQTV